MLCCFVFLIAATSNSKVIYEDETYKIFKKGKFYWMEIGDLGTAKSTPVLYLPLDSTYEKWRRVNIVGNGYAYFDIFYKNLPPPIGLLSSSDMIYINSIVYYPKEKACRVTFNGNPIIFLRSLLDEVKNV